MADLFPFEAEKYVLLGKVTKAHGIKGELKVRAYSGDPESVTRFKQLLLVSSSGSLSPVFEVQRARGGSKEAIIQLRGVTDRTHAETLCGTGVLVFKDELPDLADDEFYLHELEGLEVLTESGQAIGTVESFFNNGVQDLLVVRSESSEILIPLIPGMICSRDKKQLIIAPPPGLLEVNATDDGAGDLSH